MTPEEIEKAKRKFAKDMFKRIFFWILLKWVIFFALRRLAKRLKENED